MDTPPFGPNAILIHPDGKAHRPGCFHNDDTKIHAHVYERNWGWIPEASAEQWLRIGEGYSLRATDGDTNRTATKRCQHCPDT